MSPRLWHIVPQFAPLDGVGDYALKLGEKLREFHGIDSGYIVCWLPWRGPGEMSGFPVRQITSHRAAELAGLLEQLQVGKALLHYVGYGYQQRGVPVWLVDGLTRWKKNARADLITLFHELWSKGPPTSSVFYLSWLQRRLAAGLHRLSSRSFTSIPRYRKALDEIRPGQTELTQIPSNLDLANGSVRRDRIRPPLRACFFGQTWSRLPAVRRHKSLLEGLYARGMLEKVMVAGKDCRGGPAPSDDVSLLRDLLPDPMIEVAGELDSRAAADFFAQADFFLCAYAAADACKSTAMKSAFAAGCPVVMSEDKCCAPLVSGEHFLPCDGTPSAVDHWLRAVDAGRLTHVGREAMRWYQANAAWKTVADQFQNALMKDGDLERAAA